MSMSDHPNVNYHDSNVGRMVTVTFEQSGTVETASVRFLDEERPDETNREERSRILAAAKVLFQKAADKL